MATYRARWGEDTIEIRADFRQASCPVHGTNGRQVADFGHSPGRAMRYAIEVEARAEGMDLDDMETRDMITVAVAEMEVIDD